MSIFKPVTQALFDMDGLLLDTESIYTEVTQSIVSRFGKTFDWSLKANMIGRSSKESSKYLVKALELPISGDEYLEERDSLLREKFPSAKALPGAEALIRHLHKNNIPIAVATSSTLDLFKLKIIAHEEWFNLFDEVITSDHAEVTRAKPAPDIFLVAAKKLGGKAESSLVFEDAPAGLEAGVSAGMQVVAVPDTNMDVSRYSTAAQVLSSLTAFKPEVFDLPAM